MSLINQWLQSFHRQSAPCVVTVARVLSFSRNRRATVPCVSPAEGAADCGPHVWAAESSTGHQGRWQQLSDWQQLRDQGPHCLPTRAILDRVLHQHQELRWHLRAPLQHYQPPQLSAGARQPPERERAGSVLRACGLWTLECGEIWGTGDFHLHCGKLNGEEVWMPLKLF